MYVIEHVITMSILLKMLLLTVAEVGLVPLNRSVAENETFSVCAQITAGLLGCNISVPLDVTVQGNSTIGMYVRLA